MPDVTSSTYNYGNELIDRVASPLPPIGPDPSLTPNQSVSSDSFAQRVAATANERNPWLQNNFLNTPLNVKLSETERYQDPTYGYNPYNPNIEYQYGDRQGALEKWKNNLIKFGGNAIGSFTDGMATIPMVINAAANGKLSDIENNSLVNGVADLQLKLENDYPNYETTFGKEHPVLNYIPLVGNSGDSWGGVLKNLGYTVGAIASAVVQDAAIGAVTGGLGAVPLIGTQFARASNYLSKILNGGESAYKAYQEAKYAGIPILKAIESAARNAKIIDKARYGLALFTSATSEGLVEANQNMRDMSETLKQEFYDKNGHEAADLDLDEITNTALTSGNATLISNVALLMLTNGIQFSSLLKTTSAARASALASVDDGLNIGLKKGSLEVFEAIPDIKSGLKGILQKGITSPTAKSFVTESFEEGSQFVISDATTHYYKRKYDNKSINEVDNFVSSVSEGLHNVFTTREGLENLLIGGLSGALIHPIRSLGEKALGIKVNKEQRLQQTLELLNKNPITGLITDKFNSAVNSYNLHTNASAKLQGGDLYGYKNDKFLQLFNFVDAGIKTHRFDTQMDRLRMIKDLPFEEQAALLKITDANTTKEMLDNHVDSLITKSLEIKKDIDKIDGAFKNTFNSRSNPAAYQAFAYYKTELAVSISQLRDNKRRINSVGNEIKENLPFANIDKVANLTIDEGLKQTITDFKAKISELEKDETFFTDAKKKAEVIKEKKFLEDQISDIERLINKSKDFHKQENENGEITEQNIKDIQLPLVQSIIDYYNNGMDEKKDKIDPLDAVSVFNKAQDITKLYGDVDRLTEYYNKLLDKEGLKNFVKAEVKARAAMMAEAAKQQAQTAEQKEAAAKNINPDDISEGEDLDPVTGAPKSQTADNEKRKPSANVDPATEVKEEPFDSDAIDAEIAAKKSGLDAKLPDDLKGAKPKYSYGDKKFKLSFEKDIDKAAYIIAQSSKNKRHDDFLQFVMDNTGLTEAEAIAYGKTIKDYIKSVAKDQAGNTNIHIPSQWEKGVNKENIKKGKSKEEIMAALERERQRSAAGDDLLNAEEDKKDAERAKERELLAAREEWKKNVQSNQPNFSLDERIKEIEDKYKQKIADLEAEIKRLTNVKEKLEKEATPKETNLNKGNRKYEFNPLTYFFRLFSMDWGDGGKSRTNVTEAINNKSIQQIYDSATLTVTTASKGMKYGEYKPAIKNNKTGEAFPNMFQTGYEYAMEIFIDGKPVGLIQPSNRFAFKRGDTYFPITELTKEEYPSVTGNTANTYEDFMSELGAYDKVVNAIKEDFKNGKTEYTNAEVKKMFNINVWYGNVNYSNSPNSSTQLKNVTYDKPGNVILSLPMLINAEGVLERTNEPVVIGGEKLDQATSNKLQTFITNNLERLQGLGRRYLFIAQMPNGEYDLNSVISARPSEIDDIDKSKMLKLLTTKPKTKTEAANANSELADSFYIADANNQVRGNNLSFKLDNNGDLYFYVNNKTHTYKVNGVKTEPGFNRRYKIVDPSRFKSLDELVNSVNSNLRFQATKDKGLESLNITLTVNNVKNGILSDENVTFAEMKNKLSIAVQPNAESKSNIFENQALVIVPLNYRRPDNKPTTVKKEAPKTEAKPAPVVTPTETKTSTKAAESFVKDKEAKEKARAEAQAQTKQQVEDDFENSLGCI